MPFSVSLFEWVKLFHQTLVQNLVLTGWQFTACKTQQMVKYAGEFSGTDFHMQREKWRTGHLTEVQSSSRSNLCRWRMSQISKTADNAVKSGRMRMPVWLSCAPLYCPLRKYWNKKSNLFVFAVHFQNLEFQLLFVAVYTSVG